MKVIISYPPLSGEGCPLLGQNRQFQWFSNPTYIYPVVPASAATLLKHAGYNVIWNDAIAENWDYQKYQQFLLKEKPDLIAIETKTPVIQQHWAIIDDLKRLMPDLKVVLFGDHVTALPEESMLNSNVDYVVTGGDYDFLLLNLCNYLEEDVDLEPGIWHRANGEIKNTGNFVLNHDLDSLPFIDRDLTKWKLYAYKNGNFKRTPGTYVMTGRDCWWRKDGGCKFCAWTVLYPQYRVRSVENVLNEIGQLIEKYHFREVMDDTGTFTAGKWLRDFCKGMIERGYNNKIRFDCNLRFGALDFEDYKLMARAGFRFLLYGLESANQKTLDLLNKGIKVSNTEEELRIAKMANAEVVGNLEPHVTCMVGYPWETKEEAENTIEMTRSLFSKGLIDSLQATIVIPYPETRLFEECMQNNWLKTKDWSRYDMREPVMITPMEDEEILNFTKGIYKSFLTPKFLLRKMFSVRSVDDFKFLLRAAKAVFGHLEDFNSKMI
jgi:radical SAM superfamily enzyme YgiQ (UPF0313 family)